MVAGLLQAQGVQRVRPQVDLWNDVQLLQVSGVGSLDLHRHTLVATRSGSGPGGRQSHRGAITHSHVYQHLRRRGFTMFGLWRV